MCLLLIISCGQEDKRLDESYQIVTFSESDFGEEIDLISRSISIENLSFPRKLLIVGDCLIISDSNPNYLIQLINPNDGSYLKKFGKYGAEPGNIKHIWDLQPGLDYKSFWVYSNSDKLLSEFKIKTLDSLSSNQYKQIDDFFLATDVVWTSEATFLTKLADHSDKFVEFTTQGKMKSKYGTWKHMGYDRYPNSIIASLHQGQLKSNIERSKFAFSCIHRNIIECLDWKTKKIISIRGSKNLVNKFRVDHSLGYPMFEPSNDSRYHYMDTFLGHEYIYAIYSGKQMLSSSSTGDFCNEVLIFDYNGNPKIKLNLDKPIFSFTIDEVNKKLFGIVYGINFELIEFDLKTLNIYEH